MKKTRKRKKGKTTATRPSDELKFKILSKVDGYGGEGEINVKSLAREFACSRTTVMFHIQRERPELWVRYRALHGIKRGGVGA